MLAAKVVVSEEQTLGCSPKTDPEVKRVSAAREPLPKFGPLGMLVEQGFQPGRAPAEKIANSLGDRFPSEL